MTKFYNRCDYEWIERIALGGKILSSCYNHNYYRNTKTGEVVLEECDDCDGFDYYRISEDGQEHYIGSLYCSGGIFPWKGNLPDDVAEEEDGSVELYDD